MSAESVMADIRAVIAAAAAADPEMQASARPYPGPCSSTAPWSMTSGRPDRRPLPRLQPPAREAPQVYRKNAFNDTIRFAERGHAAVTFGPARTDGRRSTSPSTSTRRWPRPASWRSPFSTCSAPPDP